MTNEERRKAAEWFKNRAKNCPMPATRRMYEIATKAIEALPSAQPEQTDCDYCHEDRDGYVRPIEKNSHAWLVRRGRTMKLRVGFKGGYSECDILFCPMCGRRLTDG